MLEMQVVLEKKVVLDLAGIQLIFFLVTGIELWFNSVWESGWYHTDVLDVAQCC